MWSVGLIVLEMSFGAYPYPVSQNYFDLVKNIVDGPLPTEQPQVIISRRSSSLAVPPLPHRCPTAALPPPDPAARCPSTGHHLSLPATSPQVQQHLAPDLLDLVHAALDKEPPRRPDVLALMRHPFSTRHQAAPCDLCAYIRDLGDFAQQQQQPPEPPPPTADMMQG